MALKSIELTFAERVVGQQALDYVEKADSKAALHLREIRRRLEFREATRLLDKLNEKAGEFGLAVTWDELAENLTSFIERINEKLEEEKVEAEQMKLEKLRERTQRLASGPTSFTIDEMYLKFLRDDVFSRVDWKKGLASEQNPMTGAVRTVEITLPFPPAKLDIYADLVDEVNAAINRPSIEETKGG